MGTPPDGLSPSQEDYLETVRSLRASRRFVRVRDIASSRGVSMPSVVGALKRLADVGLVDYRAHEYVELTRAGEKVAERVGQRHSFLRRFLEEVLLVDPAIAAWDACVLEHALSLETMDRIAGFYQFLSTCMGEGVGIVEAFRQSCVSGYSGTRDESGTEGPACRDVAGPRRRETNVLALRPGEHGRVSGLRADPGTRRKLVGMGFLPGASVALDAMAADGQEARLKLQATPVALPLAEAACILIEAEGAAGTTDLESR